MKLNTKPEIICAPVREQQQTKFIPSIKPKQSAPKAKLLGIWDVEINAVPQMPNQEIIPINPISDSQIFAANLDYGIVQIDKSSDSGSTVITINSDSKSQQFEISNAEIEDFGIGAKPSKFYPENLTLLDMIRAIAEKVIKTPVTPTEFWTEKELKFLHECGIKPKGSS